MLAALVASTCLAVAGPNITARDLARVVPEFVPGDPNAVVAYAPAPGVERTFYAEELRQALSRMHYETAAPLSSVCFARPVVPLSTGDALAAMKRTLGESAHIEILELSRFPAPAGTIVFPREQLSAPPQAMWRGFIEYDGGKRFSIWARVSVSMKIVRAIAVEQLKPGAPIRAEQVKFETVEGFPEQRTTPQSAKAIEGYLPRRFIAADSPVWNDAIDPPNEVIKGDRVTVIVHSGQARLSFDAEAQGSGKHGDVISLKNPDSGKLFRARIEGPEQARLDTVPVKAND
ncbi:MAG TPA: flagellar basal body P-ring formation chaperone FlgA [Bryobacteraceae bacterium]|jgi:flagella basal body P-ring formation protein FlgA|nr:flagellar basal body P-ring formation chaperone FlgA [Bryobacteraceae bacterium]